VLLEVVQPFELAAPDALGATLVGVNARDLETLEVDDGRFERLAPELSAARTAPGGRERHRIPPRTSAALPRPAPVRRWSGESVMRAPDPVGRGARAGGGAA
jgi:hypothetical protein